MSVRYSSHRSIYAPNGAGELVDAHIVSSCSYISVAYVLMYVCAQVLLANRTYVTVELMVRLSSVYLSVRRPFVVCHGFL